MNRTVSKREDLRYNAKQKKEHDQITNAWQTANNVLGMVYK